MQINSYILFEYLNTLNMIISFFEQGNYNATRELLKTLKEEMLCDYMTED